MEDRIMEDSIYGWYGQIGVLMAYIDFYGLLFCVGFLVFLGLFMKTRSRGEEDDYGDSYKSANDDAEGGGTSSRRNNNNSEYTSPSIQMT